MNVYERALEVLGERGWAQGILEDDEGRVCIAGALSIAATGHGMHDWVKTPGSVSLFVGAGHVLRNLLDIEPTSSLILWNDDPHTTEEDVRLLLKRAAAGER